MARRLPVALLLAYSFFPATAYADWLITPFLGGSLAPETTLLTLEEGAGRKMTLGGSVALVSDAVLGIEADVAHTPGFFEDRFGLVLTSRVTTLTGNVVLAAPLAITQESLRPYFVGGLGLIQARSKNVVGLFPINRDLLGLSLGVGAVGFITPRAGLRFDVRRFKAIGADDGSSTRPGVSRLSFWRASAGLTLRY